MRLYYQLALGVALALVLAASAADAPEGAPARKKKKSKRPKPLVLDTDEAVAAARAQHNNLFVMIRTEWHVDCSLAMGGFKRAARDWGAPGNVTFGLVSIDGAPETAELFGVGIDGIPAYGILLRGTPHPVRYSGGWSEASIGTWLLTQQTVRPMHVGSLGELAELAQEQRHGHVALGLLDGADARSSLEQAARVSGVRLALAFGGAALAHELRAPYPCVLITNREHRRWPLLDGALDEAAVARFLQLRALPSPVAIGDSDQLFARQVREHAIRFQVLLFHRLRRPRTMADERHNYQDDSLVMRRAVHEFGAAAQAFVGAALFVSYDFFDTDPDMALSYISTENDLPAVIAVSDRGGFEERTWRLPGATVQRADVDALVSRALREVGLPQSGEAAGLRSLAPPADFSGKPSESGDVEAAGLAKFVVAAQSAAAARVA
jgi:hypothetical protein